MDRPLETVVELQQALDQRKETEERLHGIPEWMRDLHEEHSGKKAEIEGLAEAAESAAAERRGAEAGVQECQVKLQTYQEQISRVRNQREYGALLQEIDTIKSQIKAFEEEALGAMERQEESLKALEERKEGFGELDRRYTSDLQKWEAEKPQVKLQLEALEGRIEVLRERLDPPYLDLFDRIFERYDGQALAPVQAVARRGRGPQMWHCGVCNYRVRPQAVVEITNNKNIVTCDSCKRILFMAGTQD